jgi:hypothetical protein
MRNLAVIVDGVWLPLNAEGQPITNVSNNSSVTNSSMSEVDQIVSLLTQVLVRAQSLSEQDQRRVRDFVQASQAMLTATTYLPKSDQRLFETALREVAARNGQ